MSDYIPISKTRHAGFGWKHAQHYGFAAQTSMVPLVVDEINHAIATLPLAFRRLRDNSGKTSYELVALLSPAAERNLFVKPDGSWSSGYVPALFRTYPFRLLPAADTEQQIVCLDQDSGLLTDVGTPNSSPFFADNGESSPQFLRVLNFLRDLEIRRVQTQTAVDTLAELGLIIPWPIVMQDQAGEKQPIAGIFKVNAAALQQIAAEPLYRLLQCGALPLAYAQLLSEQRVQSFDELLRIQQNLIKKQVETVVLGDIEALFSGKSDILDFANF